MITSSLAGGLESLPADGGRGTAAGMRRGLGAVGPLACGGSPAGAATGVGLRSWVVLSGEARRANATKGLYDDGDDVWVKFGAACNLRAAWTAGSATGLLLMGDDGKGVRGDVVLLIGSHAGTILECQSVGQMSSLNTYLLGL